MFKAYKYRIYPNKTQMQIIEKHFGCCRYVYNWGLEQRITSYKETGKSISKTELSAKLTQLKQQKEWLYDADSQALQQTLKNLDVAFTKFFKEHTGFPKFKTKKNPFQSFSIPQRFKIHFANNTVLLPKIGLVKAILHRTFEGTPKNATISRTPTGKYFVSVLVDDEKEYPQKQLYSNEDIIGIDVGILYFAVLSGGAQIENPKYLKTALKKLKVLERQVSRKVKGSNNRRKAQSKLALIHEKIANQRNDFQHKLSAKLIRENQAIAVETLNVSGLVRNHHLAQAISDAAWSSFISKLQYKADWHGKTILKIGRFEPSSKLCSVCGFHNTELTIRDRHWKCPACNTHHDRDINAAINIRQIALKSGKLPAGRGIMPVDSL